MFEAYGIPILIITLTGLAAGIMLVVAAKFMAVPRNERLEQLKEIMPGVNCGACGYAGCDEYAAKLASGEETMTNKCIPGGDETSRQISGFLGVGFADVEEQYAIVKCAGDCDATNYIMNYQGKKSCEACNSFYQGRGYCSTACLGYGDCCEVCQYDALSIINGVAVVDKRLCTGCGMCVSKCPNDLIEVIPSTSLVYVACSSKDRGAYTRKICDNGCIGCKKCEKVCPAGAIAIGENLASVDPAACTNCGQCIDICPTGAIKSCMGL